MMFLNQPKYQQHEPTASTSQFSADDSNVLTQYPGSYSRFEIENVDSPRHICPVCDKTFRASSLLDIHMRVHVGAKPFVCPVCNHRATQKGNLKLHMKKHHGLDLPSHIDLIPDSGIWGNFPQNTSMEEMQLNAANKKKTALAHSSLLNKEVVDIIKKCQNNIGQSTMGRITESLHDFLDMAQKKIHNKVDGKKESSKAFHVHGENVNANNNGYNLMLQSPAALQSKVPFLERELLFNNASALEEQPPSIDATRNNYCCCKICGWKTTSAGYLNVHMRKHKAESHVCTICGRGFKETWYLKNHMRSHVHSFTTQVENYQAENLQSDDITIEKKLPMPDEEELQHQLSDKNALCGMCLKCGLVFPKSILRVHETRCGHVFEKSAICNYCGNSDNDVKSNFFKSLDLTVNPNPKQCSNNLKCFNSMIGCLACLPDDVNPSFSVSELTSNNLQAPIDLLKKELADSIKQHGFEITRRTFNELTKNPRFKFLVSPQSLSSVLKIFDTNDISTDSISEHQSNKDVVSSPKPYRNAAMQSLADIGKSLAMVKRVDDQIVSTASSCDSDQQEQGFQCHFCFKWFKYRSVLSIHMRSHTGERPYKCGLCGYAGTQYNCLKLHMQRHHRTESTTLNLNGEKPQTKGSAEATTSDLDQEYMFLGQAAKLNPAKCPICARVSPSPGYLKIHMRSHKQTLDHVCHICGRGFKEYWYLATHLRTHDQEVVVPHMHLKESGISNNLTKSQQPTSVANAVDLMKFQTHSTNRSEISSVCSDRNVSNSWCPLNSHEDMNPAPTAPYKSTEMSSPDAPSTSIEQSRQQYVSKRKAFQPSRFRAEPYLSHEQTTRSRKSKPRKLSQVCYLPTVSKAPPSKVEKELDEVSRIDCNVRGLEQPLDLSITLTSSSSLSWDGNLLDEPLNLAIKN